MASPDFRLTDPRLTMVLPHVGFSPLRLTKGVSDKGVFPGSTSTQACFRHTWTRSKVDLSSRRALDKDRPATRQALTLPPEVLAPTGLCFSDPQRFSTSPTSSKPSPEIRRLREREAFRWSLKELRTFIPVPSSHVTLSTDTNRWAATIRSFTHSAAFAKSHPCSAFDRYRRGSLSLQPGLALIRDHSRTFSKLARPGCPECTHLVLRSFRTLPTTGLSPAETAI